MIFVVYRQPKSKLMSGYGNQHIKDFTTWEDAHNYCVTKNQTDWNWNYYMTYK